MQFKGANLLIENSNFFAHHFEEHEDPGLIKSCLIDKKN